MKQPSLLPDPLAQFTESVSCWNFIARVKELESQGHFIPRMKVLNDNKGYEITVMPGVLGKVNQNRLRPATSDPSPPPQFGPR